VARQRISTWSACSDGVTIDLSPPKAGSVRIGQPGSEGISFQHSLNEISVVWGHFSDIEEQDTDVYTSGVDYYEVAIGSFRYGEDIVKRTKVGDATNFLVSNLALKNGAEYFGTVWATDYVGLKTYAGSDAVLVDNTPPVAGLVFEGDDPLAAFQSSTSEITAHWSGFSDEESAIVRYIWCAGTFPGATDLFDWQPTQADNEAMYALPEDLAEGQKIYVSVRAYNRVGLHVTVTGLGIGIDKSAPSGGLVRDGAGPGDINFQSSRTQVSGNWDGFVDAQSGIERYRWCVGTNPSECDVVPISDVGLKTSASATGLHLYDGMVLTVTVEACNHAGLCARKTSDGFVVDGTPPIAGIVLDGYAGLDAAYSPRPKTFELHWDSFFDPDSGIAYFEWCAGTTVASCDEISWQMVYLDSKAFGTKPNRANLTMQTLYGSVRATNKAGLSVIMSSNGVRVDSTPPIAQIQPYFDVDMIGGIRVQIPDLVEHYQPFMSILRAAWSYVDAESSIHHLTWSARVHHDYQGSQPVNAIYVTDNTEGIKADIQLIDGDKYFLSVHACNGARVCLLQDSINYMFVDGTPPTRGWPSEDMTWSSSGNTATIRWFGFRDSQSPMVRYYVTLNGKMSSLQAASDNDQSIYGLTINAAGLTVAKVYRVVIRGVNSAGLSSAITFAVEAHGNGALNVLHEVCHLEVLCQKQYASNSSSPDGCAPIFGVNPSSPRSCICNIPYSPNFCVDTVADRATADASILSGLEIQVDDGFQPTVDLDYQPFVNVLGGTWRVTSGAAHAAAVLRYDWTVGLKPDSADEPYPGMGFFQSGLSEGWQYAGLSTHGVFTVPGSDTSFQGHFESGTSYYFYVRAWLSDKQFRIFRSDGVQVRNSGPQLKYPPRVLDGQLVRNPDYWINSTIPNPTVKSVLPYLDVEYQPSSRIIAATWSWPSHTGMDGMFFLTSELSALSRFEWAVGSYPGSTDLRSFSPLANATSGNGRVTLTNPAVLKSGVRYYSSVRAYDIYGLFAEFTSNGVTTDLTPPLVGAVFDGPKLKDYDVQASASVVAASWTGFRDYESGIVNYEIAVSSTNSTTTVLVAAADFQYNHKVPSDPNAVFVSMGLYTTAKLPVSSWSGLQLISGVRYYVFVRATNAAGYVSDVVSSNGFVVDVTPPAIYVCTPESANQLSDPSFETVPSNRWLPNGAGMQQVANSTRLETPDSSHWFYVLESSGSSISQNFTSVPGTRYRLTFSAAGYPRGAVQGQAGHVEAGTLDQPFLLSEGHINGFWRSFSFEFFATDVVTRVSISCPTKSLNRALAIDNVSVNACKATTAQVTLTNTWKVSTGREFAALDGRGVDSGSLSCQSGSLNLPVGWVVAADDTATRRVVAEHKWGAVCAVLDSGLSYFTGSRSQVAGSPCASCGASGCLTITSGRYAPTDCNSVSRIILIERLNAVHAGKWYQNTRSHMQASWLVVDPESGIENVQWAIGTVPGGAQILPFTNLGSNMYGDAHGLKFHHGMQVYVSVVATNPLGLVSRFISMPIIIDHTPPVPGVVVDLANSGSASSADVDFITEPILRASWAAFVDIESGIQWCNVGFGRQPGLTDVVPFTSITRGSEVGLEATFVNLSLVHGETYYATVRCSNFADLIDHAYSDGVVYISRPPSIASAYATFELKTPGLYAGFGSYASSTDKLVLHWDGFDALGDSLQYEVLFAEDCDNVTAKTDCGVGFFYDPSILDPDFRCRPCHAACAKCVGPSDSDCQDCRLGYRFDGRACWFHDCPSGYAEDFATASCWRQTQRTTMTFEPKGFPLREGCIYRAKVRGYYAFGSAPRSSPVVASVIIDSTAPVVYPRDLVMSVRNGVALIDWQSAVSEDFSPYEIYYAVGTASSGRWDIIGWTKSNNEPVISIPSVQYVVGKEYVAGIRVINAGGYSSTGTVTATYETSQSLDITTQTQTLLAA